MKSLLFILLTFPLFISAQGYGYIIFSETGDTVMVRTSFGEINKKDTITTYFVIYEKGINSLNRLSILTVDEKRTKRHSKGYACADFRSIPADTIQKYNFTYVGSMVDPKKEKIKINSKILNTTDTLINDKKMYYRQIKVTFKMKNELFLTKIIYDFVEKRNKPIEKPWVTKIYYNKLIDKYLIEYMIVDNYINPATSNIIKRSSREEILY